MATVLIASTPIAAHTLNATAIAAGLVGRGHRVLWYAGRLFHDHIAAQGATPLPFAEADDYASTGPAAIARGGVQGLAAVRRLYRDVLVGQAPQHVADITQLVRAYGVDLLVSDTLMLGAGLCAAREGVPFATFGDGPLLWADADTPPFGSGLRPLAGPAGRHRNRTVQRVVDRWLLGAAQENYVSLRTQLGLPVPGIALPMAGMSPQLHLQGCSPGFEYPRAALPAHIHFVGVLGPGAGYAPDVPAALTRANRQRPLAFVTQGTLRRDVTELAVPAARALSADGFDVLVAAGTGEDACRQAVMRRPSRGVGTVTVTSFVDYEAALREADLFVTNGGYTGVTLALARGVPVLQVGATEEKPDIGARLEWAGVGRSVRRTRPSARTLRRAARSLRSPAREQASRRLADELSGYDARALSADLLESLLAKAEHHG